jgi:hypothetical protein
MLPRRLHVPASRVVDKNHLMMIVVQWLRRLPCASRRGFDSYWPHLLFQ